VAIARNSESIHMHEITHYCSFFRCVVLCVQSERLCATQAAELASMKAKLASKQPHPIGCEISRRQNGVEWEVRSVSHWFRWEQELRPSNARSDSFERQNGSKWHLYLLKDADSSSVDIGLRLESAPPGASHCPYYIALQKVPPPELPTPPANHDVLRRGFHIGPENRVHAVNVNGRFPIGEGRSTPSGFTLSSLHTSGVYNAERDSILIVCHIPGTVLGEWL
jgi:hypothetical protein